MDNFLFLIVVAVVGVMFIYVVTNLIASVWYGVKRRHFIKTLELLDSKKTEEEKVEEKV